MIGPEDGIVGRLCVPGQQRLDGGERFAELGGGGRTVPGVFVGGGQMFADGLAFGVERLELAFLFRQGAIDVPRDGACFVRQAFAGQDEEPGVAS